MGHHTGENMAAAVWETIEAYELKGKASTYSLLLPWCLLSSPLYV
jgi:hypothetical protein